MGEGVEARCVLVIGKDPGLIFAWAACDAMTFASSAGTDGRLMPSRGRSGVRPVASQIASAEWEKRYGRVLQAGAGHYPIDSLQLAAIRRQTVAGTSGGRTEAAPALSLEVVLPVGRFADGGSMS